MIKVIYAVEMIGDGPSFLFEYKKDAEDICILENQLFDQALDEEDRGRKYYSVVSYLVLDTEKANKIRDRLKKKIEDQKGL